jgi:hypothetical protein
MINETLDLARPPRFNAGQQIRTIAPGPHKGKRGLVLEVIRRAGDLVYRYRVQFFDGTSAIFFGFELEAETP